MLKIEEWLKMKKKKRKELEMSHKEPTCNKFIFKNKCQERKKKQKYPTIDATALYN